MYALSQAASFFLACACARTTLTQLEIEIEIEIVLELVLVLDRYAVVCCGIRPYFIKKYTHKVPASLA